MMKRLFLLIILLVTQVHAKPPGPPKGNGAWAYDAIYNAEGKRIGFRPGLFACEIKTYIDGAEPSHSLTQTFPWGGYIKMFCLGSGGTPPDKPCTDDDFLVHYNQSSTAAYYNQLDIPGKPVLIMPIVDGLIGGDFLKNFNTMDQRTAQRFADAVTKVYCADDKVAGVQFDLERFDATQPGQIFFYNQIAKNFAGQHTVNAPDPYGCVNANHPRGRYFSVFSTARALNQEVSVMLNTYNNGFFIGALYTLGPVSDKANPPDLYKTYAVNEVKRMVKQAKLYNVKYQFGIPASGTMEEFETRDGVPSGYQQLTYVQIAMEAINEFARPDKNFLGVSLWAYSSRRIMRESEYTPAIPPLNVLAYLANTL